MKSSSLAGNPLKMRWKFAAVQFPIDGGLTKAQFFAKFENYVREAKQNQADVVIFPELIVFDLVSRQAETNADYGRELRTVAQDITPDFFDFVQQLTQNYSISILGGSSPTVRADGQIVNTAILTFADGSPRQLQNKNFLTPDEVEYGWVGDQGINTFNAPWGKSTVLICHDCEFPKISNKLVPLFPEYILVPSMTGDVHGFNRVRRTSLARSVEHFAYVVHTGTTSTRNEYFGQAGFITPQEQTFPTQVQDGPANQSAIIYRDLDTEQLRDHRSKARIYPARDQFNREHNTEEATPFIRRGPSAVMDTGVVDSAADSAVVNSGAGSAPNPTPPSPVFNRGTVVHHIGEMQIAVINDPTNSTGATLFYFPKGAQANYDSRGGSVASMETSLLDEGGYSNQIDAVLFTGGSTMGHGAGHGVRARLFEMRMQAGQKPQAFDLIPSVPGAVVYDFGGRIHQGANPYVYPDEKMGYALLDHLQKDVMPVGRIGAGITTSVNKISKRRWGGQGSAYIETPYGKIFAAVVLNSMGNLTNEGQPLAEKYPPIKPDEELTSINKVNTTLSIIVTDIKLDRNQLKRYAMATHTSMARMIHPFQTYSDGDIQFAVSVGDRTIDDKQEFDLILKFSEAMKLAIINAIDTSNQAPTPSAKED